MNQQTLDARRSRQALLAGSVGNFIEWYEFGVYGFLATVIAANFFTLQGENEITSLILTYAAFALAFFCRPIGAVIFGRIGDRIGRRPTLIAVLLLMTLATALIGVMPTYASIGVAAPLLLTLLRMFQGLFAGGEFGGAVSLMTEFAPKGKRGLFGAWQSLTVALGLLAGAGLVALLAALLSVQQLHDWGWRIPFLLALPLGAVALWLRLKLEETPTVHPGAATCGTRRRAAGSEAGRRGENHSDRHRPHDGLVGRRLYLPGGDAFLFANLIARHLPAGAGGDGARQRRLRPDHSAGGHCQRQTGA